MCQCQTHLPAWHLQIERSHRHETTCICPSTIRRGSQKMDQTALACDHKNGCATRCCKDAGKAIRWMMDANQPLGEGKDISFHLLTSSLTYHTPPRSGLTTIRVNGEIQGLLITPFVFALNPGPRAVDGSACDDLDGWRWGALAMAMVMTRGRTDCISSLDNPEQHLNRRKALFNSPRLE